MTPEYFEKLAYIWMTIGVLVFILLFKVQAPYGRHNRVGWGPEIDNRLAWILMELVVLLSLALFFWQGKNNINQPVALMVGLFTVHYVHRSFIFPLKLRTRGKKMPAVIMLMAMGFNTMNGFLLGWYFGNIAQYPAEWVFDPRFSTGVLLFISGMSINIWSDYHLIALRKPGETGYRIPRGGFFQYVSCPNHFGEILEWTGFAILSWSLPGLVFAVWTFANLAPRSLAHHRWYREHFPDYPAGRKAFIPGIW